ncbi:hypothetical protein GRI33_07085 [Brucella sp. BO3]|uniref:hypothetical protein n=1 Tax=unclassified Brucella TaxID=2632610 RepID=UPI00084F96DB|nr:MULTISPECIES: hypothetical protein [unclassified Brucella]OEI84662.1 hypothetical protein BA060_02195 [Brucella sp. B13-0095]QMV26700.1 hypothetical protein GRI33_07085 [Brucella sp. BO3]
MSIITITVSLGPDTAVVSSDLGRFTREETITKLDNLFAEMRMTAALLRDRHCAYASDGEDYEC